METFSWWIASGAAGGLAIPLAQPMLFRSFRRSLMQPLSDAFALHVLAPLHSHPRYQAVILVTFLLDLSYQFPMSLSSPAHRHSSCVVIP